jgi:hypothetical protein
MARILDIIAPYENMGTHLIKHGGRSLCLGVGFGLPANGGVGVFWG